MTRSRDFHDARADLRRVYIDGYLTPRQVAARRIERGAVQDEDIAMLRDSVVVLGVVRMLGDGSRVYSEARPLERALIKALIEPPRRVHRALDELRAAWEVAPEDLLTRAIGYCRARVAVGAR